MLRPIMDRNDFDNTLKASCAAQIVLAPAGTAPEWIQLTPLGAFETVDGRKYTVRDSAAVIAASKMPAPVDYDHGTDTGAGSRAAGWMEELQPQGPKGEPGLWARMKWTDNGAKAIAGHEYRFISPTFIHDKANIVTRILRAGLLNNPAIGELPALASQQENELDQIKQIAVAMGLPETATLSEILAAITAAKNNNTALASRTKLLGEVATAAGLTIAGDKIGETEVTAICAKLKTPAATGDNAETVATLSAKLVELRTELVALKNAGAAKDAETRVAEAIAAGKLAPAAKDDAIALCKESPEAFERLMAKQPAIVAAGRQSREDAGRWRADGRAEDALRGDGRQGRGL
jgi:phage I-like protein